MIKFFRRIRQSLLAENRFSKYLLYAFGEIILVVIGILIALWISNLNQEHQQSKERSILIDNLKQELNENLNQFKERTEYLNEMNKNLIEVMNFSATSETKKSLDSLRNYISNILTVTVVQLNNSRLSSAKSSGKFSLLSQEITTALSDYETTTTNYLKFLDKTTFEFKEDWSNSIITFNSLSDFHNRFSADTPLINHPELALDEETFTAYIKDPKTYKLLHRYYTKYMVETGWLRGLQNSIESTIKTIDAENND